MDETTQQRDEETVAAWRELAFSDLAMTLDMQTFTERRRKEDEIVHAAAAAMSRIIDRVNAERKRQQREIADLRHVLHIQSAQLVYAVKPILDIAAILGRDGKADYAGAFEDLRAALGPHYESMDWDEWLRDVRG